MASESELQKIKKLARDSGNMETTPYLVGGKVLKKSSFTNKRTSKVMYMNELLVPEAMALSKKVSQITRYRLKEEIYASENFQIMNYGIGLIKLSQGHFWSLIAVRSATTAGINTVRAF